LIRQMNRTQGHSDDLVCLGYSAGSLVTIGTIQQSWAIGDSSSEGRSLPPDVLHELWIDAQELTAQSISQTQIAAFRYSGIIYQIIRPSPFPPSGLDIFWRFWIAPQENA
jgi:hypothetical protein